MIKAIETCYKGYRFRSRLEARWAVFFDALGMKWEYEPQGFHVSSLQQLIIDESGNETGTDGRKWLYLPDFYLSDLGTWVEVKGSLDGVTDDYLEMIANAIDWGGALPGVSDSTGTTRGLLWLGSIPSYDTMMAGAPAHVILQHCKGGDLNSCYFTTDGSLEADTYGDANFDSSWGEPASAQVIRKTLVERIYQGQYRYTKISCPGNVRRAYNAARSARFEHGEKGSVAA